MDNSIPFVFVTAANTTPVEVGSGASNKFAGASINNNSATLGLFIRLWWDGQTGLAPVPGTTVPSITLSCPGAAAAPAVGASNVDISNPVVGVGKLWVWATAGSAAVSDTTAPAAGNVTTIYLQ